MKETYFIIRNSDGDTTVTPINKEDLLERINDGDFENIFTEFPNNHDTNYWGEGVLIIKGKMVSPIEKRVVTEFEID